MTLSPLTIGLNVLCSLAKVSCALLLLLCMQCMRGNEPEKNFYIIL